MSSKLNLALGVLFVLFVLLISAAENDSVENSSGNQSSELIFPTVIEPDASEQANLVISGSNGTIASDIVVDTLSISESIDANANIEEQPKISEEKRVKSVSASFGVYLEIVG